MQDEGLLSKALQAGVLTWKSWSLARSTVGCSATLLGLCWNRADGSREAKDFLHGTLKGRHRK
jgi:hypothetical protein